MSHSASIDMMLSVLFGPFQSENSFRVENKQHEHVSGPQGNSLEDHKNVHLAFVEFVQLENEKY